MPQFKLKFKNIENKMVEYQYTTENSDLIDLTNGAKVLFPTKESIDESVKSNTKLVAAQRFSPENPATKAGIVKLLKIQLGLGCNYSCKYCLQNKSRPTEKTKEKSDQFLANLDSWFKPEHPDGKGLRVEFWGGEPLMYWDALKSLATEFRRRYPEAQFGMVTNGSLLTPEIIDDLFQLNFLITMSHDGPAYEKQRGRDPLENTKQRDIIKYAFHKFNPLRKFAFNCVLTNQNFSLAKVKDHIAQRLEIASSEIRLSTEGALAAYDDAGLAISFKSNIEGERLINLNFWESLKNSDLSSTVVASQLRSFANSINQSVSSSSLGQKCGMDLPNTYAVDLDGNVITCQNVLADKGHKIGHVSALSEVKLDTGLHWSHRPECNQCPVVHLCKGSCFYNEGKYWQQSCDNSYYYYLFLLASFFYWTQNLLLIEVEGETLRRPQHGNKTVVLHDKLVNQFLTSIQFADETQLVTF